MYYAIDFAFPHKDIDFLRTFMEAELGISFECRYSDFHGGCYYFSSQGSEQLTLQYNEELDEIAEEKYASFPLLLGVEGTTRPEDIHRAVSMQNGVVVRETCYSEP